MFHSPRVSRVSGFTLIELLLVLSIIAMISATLMPVFAKVREGTRRTSCASNLKQLGLSISLYAQDYDERYPLGVIHGEYIDSDGGVPNPSINLKKLPLLKKILRPYTKSSMLWSCPSDTGSTRASFHLDMTDDDIMEVPPFPSAFEFYGTSYQYHTSLALQQVLYPASAYTRDNPTQQIGPSQVGVLADMLGRWHGGESIADTPRLNVLFADGHVKSQKAIEFIVGWNRRLEPSTENGEPSPDD